MEYIKDTGTLEFKGIRYLLIRPETIMGFFKAVAAELGARTGDKAFAGGEEGGAASTAAYKAKFNLSNTQIVEYMCSMGTQLGWGAFRLEEQSSTTLRISVANSAFAVKDALTGDRKNGSCHFIRGVLAGLGKTVFNTAVTATEPKCKARGDDHCVFLIKKNPK